MRYLYRVEQWSEDGRYPVVPCVAEAVWRRHNLYPDTLIETQRPLSDVAALDAESEAIPENGIGDWTDGNCFGVVCDEEARKPFAPHSDSWNQCHGLSYDFLHAFKVAEFLTLMAPEDATPAQVASLARLRERMKSVPLGKLVQDEPIHLGDWKQLVTGRELKPREWGRMARADRDELRIQSQMTVAEVRLSEPAQARMAKVPGWTPTSAYMGAIRDFFASSGTINWQSNADQYAMVFTAGSSYTLAAACMNLKIAGTPSGELTMRIYAGDPSGARTTIATGNINLAELTTSLVYIWFGLATAALTSAAVYTLELSTTATLDANNYIQIAYNGTGGAAGNQEWKYSGGSWAAQGTNRLAFYTADNSNGGKFLIRADGNGSTIFSASGPKGAAADSTDTYTVTMGATLTRDDNRTLLQGRQGDTVSGTSAAYGAQVAGYRYGYEVFNAGITATWTGDATGNSSGYVINPASADVSSKQCRVYVNGTAASSVVWTNLTSTNNSASRWSITWSYGSIIGQYFITQFMVNQYVLSYGYVNGNSARTSATSAALRYWTVRTVQSNIYDVLKFTDVVDTTLNWDHLTIVVDFSSAYIPFPGLLGKASGAGQIILTNLRIQNASGVDATYTIYPVGSIPAGASRYFDTLVSRGTTDIRFDDTIIPADFTVTDFGTGGTLKATVSNISSIAAGDYLVVCDASGHILARYSRSRYEASYVTGGYGTKPADCALVPGLTDGVTYSGLYCYFTRDSILCGPNSATASGTPTHSSYDFPAATSVAADDTTDGVAGSIALASILPPRGTCDKVYSAAEYLVREALRNISAGASNILATAYELIAGERIDGEYIPPAVDIPAFREPLLVVHDGGNGSVTVDITGNKLGDGITNQVSRLKYRLPSDAAWTVYGSVFTGNGSALAGPSGLAYGAGAEAYTFQLVPYDASSGAEGPGSRPVAVRLEDVSATASTSELDDEMAAGCAEMLAELGRTVTYCPHNGEPVERSALVTFTGSQMMEIDGRQELIQSGPLRLPATVATAPDRRDSFVINGQTYGCEAPPKPPAGGWVQFSIRRQIRVMQGAGKTRG